MALREHLKFSLIGFSPSRVGFVVGLLNLGLVPGHFFVSCQVSGAIVMANFVLSAITVVFWIFNPKAAWPLALGLLGFMAHGLCAH